MTRFSYALSLGKCCVLLLLSIRKPICTCLNSSRLFSALYVGTQYISTVAHAIALPHFLVLHANVVCLYITCPPPPFTFPTVSHPNTKVQRQPTNVSVPASSSRHGRRKPTTWLCRTVPHTIRCGRAARPTGQDVGEFGFPSTGSRSVLARQGKAANGQCVS